MDNLLAVLVATLVTLFFVRNYLRKMTPGKQHGAREAAGVTAAPVAASPQKMRPCPRCSKAILEASAFCSHCGAALAMWSVHRAEVRTGAATGKPKPVINASLCIGCGSCVEVCPETGTLELAGGKAILAHPERCTGHAKCAEVCPTQAILYSFDGVLQTVRVPMVKENFETNVPGLYIVGELGGMGLIKTAINEGKLVIDHVRARLGTAAAPKPDAHGAPSTAAPVEARTNGHTVWDVVIVGAGPAGLSAALTAQQYGLNYLAIEQGEIASTIRHYPRHKFLMAEPLQIPLYGTLYVSDGTKEALLSVWETIIRNTGVRVQTNERVENVVREGAGFVVTTSKGRYQARQVVLALGRRGTPRSLGVPGEDLGKVSYQLIEAETYENKDILVAGGGDSAIEAALGLSKHGRNRVTLAYRGEVFQRARERNRKLLTDAEAAGQLKILRNAQVAAVRPETVLLAVAGKPLEVQNDYLFVLIGGSSPEEFLKRTGVEIVEKSLSVNLEKSFA
jgi:putative YpdA family bacillithiol system oxidoreductase